MSNLPTVKAWKDATPITLQDGSQLNRPQSHAILLTLQSELDQDEIATECGYASRATLQSFLRTPKAQEALGLAMIANMNSNAAIGLRTMVSLAKGAKSELVRQSAAKDLMDRAGLTLEKQNGPGGGSFSINIDLGGGGEKLSEGSPSNPGQPVQNPAKRVETIDAEIVPSED